MRIVKVPDIVLIKLSVSVGLVMGFGSMLAGTWGGIEWWMKNWKVIQELLGLGWGVVYVMKFSKEVKRINFKLLTLKYIWFVLWLIMVWGGWMAVVWWVSGGNEFGGLMDLGEVVGAVKGRGIGFWLQGILTAVKILGLGLGVVMGYRWLNSNVKAQSSKIKSTW